MAYKSFMARSSILFISIVGKFNLIRRSNLSPSSIQGEIYMKKKYYILYMAYTIWNLRQENLEHMSIAAKKDGEFEKHFGIHKCNVDDMGILMKVIKTWFPEIYDGKGKSVQQHYDEAQKILEDNLFGKKYKKLI